MHAPPENLNDLIAAHAAATRVFREAVHNAQGEDDAFEAEAAAMMALCLFHARNMEEVRNKAAYLGLTRFADDLTIEGRAFLLSFAE